MSTTHFTYILFSVQLNRYYIGSCSVDLGERLRKHLSNHKGYTGKAKDWEVVYFEEFDNVSNARKRELQIKKWKSRKMIEALITSL